MNSIEAFEEFMGDQLDEQTLQRLVKAPEDQIVQFGYILSEKWDSWLSGKFEARDRHPELPIFLQPGFHHGAASLITDISCKKMALYFNNIVIPDLLEASVTATMAVWSSFGFLDIDTYRNELQTGYSALIKILPLLRVGAVSLAPLGLVGLRDVVQENARREHDEIQRSSSPPLNKDEADEFALASAICAKTIHWPVAGSERLWKRLKMAPSIIESHNSSMNTINHAIAELEVPSAARVSMRDIINLRANEEAFANFRDAYSLAMREAAEIARSDGNDVAQIALRDRLQSQRDRCVAAAKRTSALDGLLLPTGALLGAACVNYSLGVLPTGLADLEKLAVELAAPGAVWLSVLLGQSLRARSSGKDPAAAVYGALIEG